MRKIDGRTYLMAYPADPAGEPYCALVTDGDDTTALWVQLTIDVILIGLGVWGLKRPAGTDKLTKVGVAMWRSEPVRQAFMALYAADVTMTPQAFLGAGQAMYREGFLSQVLACFSLSWFTLVRLVALFVPWVAVAFVVTDLAKVANDIWQRTRRKPDQPAPAVSAIAQKAVDVTGAVPITVNGDAVTAMVVLTAPPSAVVSVTGSQAMLALSPQTLTFSPANWSVPQPVDITAAATDENSVPRDSRVRITWAGAGVVGEACVDMHVQVAKLVCPEEIQLRQNDSGDYEADFELSISAEIASDAPVTVELKSPNGSDGHPIIEFQPSTLTFQNTAELASLRGNKPPPQTVRASRKRAAPGDDTTTTTVDAHSQPGKAVAQHRYNLRVHKPEITEEIVLTMVHAGSGNCFVLKNTSYQKGKQLNVETSVFDGGKPGTYKRMADYLPPSGSAIKYLLCTHYDNDHIAGLIDLMVARAADVGSVLFNPPLPLALDGVHEDPTATSNNIMSVTQAYRLVALATSAGKIICPVIGNPPASLKDPRFALPSLEFRFVGPTAVVAAENRARPTDSIKINRASIMFLLASTTADSGFKMLMTGDGYNVLPRLDVTGPQPAGVQKIDFLQVPHHGSVENSDTSLYRIFLAKHYLISSSYSAYSGAHPAVKVIQDIVGGATSVGHDNFTIWINDPNLPSDFQLPPSGNFAIYRLNQNESGGSFVYRTGQQIIEPSNYTLLI
ncbi:hypothetical protein [Pseudomonas costantinii]|uniref:hypothetical protein n=1 Tax=Pseudomonas costantinii TaxID=168469 RepID=UPI0015A178BE|nr:hypothetical protein [Pseudomonas costantinii]NVZ68214.1 hypothetical protein [Pseudomonas costantinii]